MLTVCQADPASDRARSVPNWFMNLLHVALQAEVDSAYRMIQALYALSVLPAEDGRVIVELAKTPNQGKAAAGLGVSRHHVCRRMKRLRKVLGKDALRDPQLPEAVITQLEAFVKLDGAGDPNLRTVVERLGPLSRNELGVLFAIVRRWSVSETLAALGIGHTRYHQIKAKLAVAFLLPPARITNFKLCACMRDEEMVKSQVCTEKLLFRAPEPGVNLAKR